MIDVEMDAAHSVALVRPQAPLDKSDFAELAKTIDPQIESAGELAGLIIDAPTFPGWDSFGALVTHLRFIREHQKHVKKIAVVTDSPVGDLAEHLASHFVAAQIKHFPAGQAEAAKDWMTGRG